METVEDEILWELCLATVLEIFELLELAKEKGGYLPKFTEASVTTFRGGWPNILKGSSKDCPVRPSELFGFGNSTLSFETNFEGLSATAPLMNYVIANESHASQFQTFPSPEEGGPDPAKDEVLTKLKRWEIFQLPLAIADRAVAVGDFSDDFLRASYKELEAGRLADRLAFEIVAPITLLGFDFEGSLELDRDVAIESIGEALHKARYKEHYGVQPVPKPLIDASTHAIIIKNLELNNRPHRNRKLQPFSVVQDYLEVVDLVCNAIQVLTANPVGYAQVLIRPVDWSDGWNYNLPAIEEAGVVRSYPSSFDNFGWLRDVAIVQDSSTKQLPKIFKRLQSSPSSVRLAARRLSGAELRDTEDDMVVDACIGLEALLGQEKDELTHRLSQRAATVLATREADRMDAAAVYAAARCIYSHRSSVVHGSVKRKYARYTWGDGQTTSTTSLAVQLLRLILLDKLRREPAWTPESLDKLALTALTNYRVETEVTTDGDHEQKAGEGSHGT